MFADTESPAADSATLAATGRLPRGRHQLTREQVQDAQRIRMLLAMAEAMTVKGYVGTTVADVIKGAGVSRETFYQQFAGKLECFLAAFEAAAGLLLLQLGDVLDVDGTPIERFEAAFTAYLDALAAEPAFARVFLVEVYAAGPEAIERRARAQHRIAERLAELLDLQSPADRFACDAVVAAVATLVTAPLVRGDTEALLALREPIVALVARLLP